MTRIAERLPAELDTLANLASVVRMPEPEPVPAPSQAAPRPRKREPLQRREARLTVEEVEAEAAIFDKLRTSGASLKRLNTPTILRVALLAAAGLGRDRLARCLDDVLTHDRLEWEERRR